MSVPICRETGAMFAESYYIVEVNYQRKIRAEYSATDEIRIVSAKEAKRLRDAMRKQGHRADAYLVTKEEVTDGRGCS